MTAKRRLHILIADENADLRLRLSRALFDALGGEFDVEIGQVDSTRELMLTAGKSPPQILFIGRKLGDGDGVAILHNVQYQLPTVRTVFLAAPSEGEQSLEALKAGAVDFVNADDLDGPRLTHAVQSCLERASHRQELMRAERMAAIGTLAGGVAHEFNNILQVVLGHSQFALSQRDPERYQKALELCRDASERGSRIVKQLLAFARRPTGRRRRFSIEEAVRAAATMEQPALEADQVTLAIHKHASPIVRGDRGELEQVLLNLFSNARHACVAARAFSADKVNRIDITIRADEKSAIIEVTDNGVGISPEDMPRIFDAFFTTKGALGGRVYDGKQNGTGLGLSICQSIVNEHGGRIEVSSRQGAGSTFRLVLPLSASQELPTQIVKPGLRAATTTIPEEVRGRKVLVVDDEAMIGELIREYLGHKGLEADLATSAERGMELARHVPYALMLFDLNLPGDSGGREMLEQLREEDGPNSETPALAMTGQILGMDDNAMLASGFRGVLHKPFEVRELGRLILAAIEADASEPASHLP
jgi:signal transduction histidine kinase